MKQKTLIIGVCVILLSVLLISGCGQKKQTQQNSSNG